MVVNVCDLFLCITYRQAEEAQRRREIFEAHLEREGLELEREHTEKHHFVKIHAPHELLCRYCEIMKLRMPMKQVSPRLETKTDICFKLENLSNLSV